MDNMKIQNVWIKSVTTDHDTETEKNKITGFNRTLQRFEVPTKKKAYGGGVSAPSEDPDYSQLWTYFRISVGQFQALLQTLLDRAATT